MHLCDKCPFRKDRPPYLTKQTIEQVAKRVSQGEIFPCHKVKKFNVDECKHDHWCAGAKSLLVDKNASGVIFDNVEDLLKHHEPVKKDSFFDGEKFIS